MNDLQDINDLIARMAGELNTLIQATGRGEPAMVGIHTGGVWVARQLHQQLGMNPVVKPSQMPFSIDDRHIILVDDVLHTGRTIRAAMNELFDYGRPASIILAVLVERDGRELPVEANIVGAHVELKSDEHIKLSGPDPLELEIKQAI
jgi:pyrimidine operon attenuation protein/uracil phosphoribosyltransferase